MHYFPCPSTANAQTLRIDGHGQQCESSTRKIPKMGRFSFIHSKARGGMVHTSCVIKIRFSITAHLSTSGSGLPENPTS